MLVHVVNFRDAGRLSGRLQEFDREFLEKQKVTLGQKGIKVTVEAPIGLTSYEIYKISEKERVSLIIVGSHGRNLAKKIILGGTCEQIIKDTRKPVLMIKFHVKEGEGCSLFCENIFRAILYPTDFSPEAEKVLPYVKKELDAGCDKIVLLHVLEGYKIEHHLVKGLDECNKIDQERLDRIKKELLDAGAKDDKTIIESGKTIPTILKVSESENVCFIALGARGVSLFKEIFIGGVANNVARYAKMLVLFVT